MTKIFNGHSWRFDPHGSATILAFMNMWVCSRCESTHISLEKPSYNLKMMTQDNMLLTCVEARLLAVHDS